MWKLEVSGGIIARPISFTGPSPQAETGCREVCAPDQPGICLSTERAIMNVNMLEIEMPSFFRRR